MAARQPGPCVQCVVVSLSSHGPLWRLIFWFKIMKMDGSRPPSYSLIFHLSLLFQLFLHPHDLLIEFRVFGIQDTFLVKVQLKNFKLSY